MQIVYHAAHSADAQLVRGLLAEEGIRSFVFGGALEGGAGLLPVGGAVRLEVADEDVERARAIIQAWQDTAVPLDDDDDTAADREADNDYGDDDTPAHVESGNLYRPLNQRLPSRHTGAGLGGIVFALIVGALGGAIAAGIAMQPRASQQSVDYNGDGRPDEALFYEGERLQRVDADRNNDGEVDQRTHYDERGLPTEIEEDQDFDGVRETASRYENGQFAGRSADYDGDGQVDWQQTAKRGVLQNEQWFDKRGNLVKHIDYVDNRPVSGEFDSNGDGVRDTARDYDPRGEINASRPLPAPTP
ncbi:putative signal transducing protein [Lysobacter sp. CA196]|uniref:putative signal transducing protein n=1 Tax=Lysobacter sp. CA196 TaxID=3455606 RepID=UPI003F8D8D4C